MVKTSSEGDSYRRVGEERRARLSAKERYCAAGPVGGEDRTNLAGFEGCFWVMGSFDGGRGLVDFLVANWKCVDSEKYRGDLLEAWRSDRGRFDENLGHDWRMRCDSCMVVGASL